MKDMIWKKYFDNSPNAYCIVEAVFDSEVVPKDYIYLAINKAYEQLMDLKSRDVCGKRFYELFPSGWEGETEWIHHQKKAIINREETQFVIFRGKKWIRVILFPLEKNIFGFIHYDVTREYMMDDELEGFLKVNIDIFCVSDREGTVIRANKAFEHILGYKVEEIEGKNLLDFIHKDDIPATLRTMEQFEKRGIVSSFINRFCAKDGNYRYLEWHSKPLGKYIYSSARDVTEKRVMEDKLRENNARLQKMAEKLKMLADKDELTGLYNRHYLYERIDDEIKRADKENLPLSIIIFDLDHFKKVNDTWGHPVGDMVLKEAAKLPKQHIGPEDFLVRLGGEEFMAVLIGKDLFEAEKIAEKMRKTMEGHDFYKAGRLTASFGVAEREGCEHFYSWYKRADEAMYRAKKLGRNCVYVSRLDDRDMCGHTRLIWKKELESGVDIIDEQHKGLFKMANLLINLSISGAEPEVVSSNIALAIKLIEEHFRTEEKILYDMGYPKLKEHADSHNRLLKKARRLQEAYEKGEVRLSAIFTFLIDDVIIHHSKMEDAEYFPHVQKMKNDFP